MINFVRLPFINSHVASGSSEVIHSFCKNCGCDLWNGIWCSLLQFRPFILRSTYALFALYRHHLHVVAVLINQQGLRIGLRVES